MSKEKGNLLDNAKKLGINLSLDDDSDPKELIKDTPSPKETKPQPKSEKSVEPKVETNKKAQPAKKESSTDLFAALTDDDDDSQNLAPIKLKLADLAEQTTQMG